MPNEINKITDQENNEIPRASILLKPLSEISPGSRTTELEQQGLFSIENVYPSQYVLIARAPGYKLSPPQMIKVAPASTIEDIKILLEKE